jgi:hypothetical protein
LYAAIAQLAEQGTLNPKVEGSIPSGGTGGLPKRGPAFCSPLTTAGGHESAKMRNRSSSAIAGTPTPTRSKEFVGCGMPAPPQGGVLSPFRSFAINTFRLTTARATKARKCEIAVRAPWPAPLQGGVLSPFRGFATNTFRLTSAGGCESAKQLQRSPPLERTAGGKQVRATRDQGATDAAP